ncbi:unnamed protein product [Protopolystoma xenopodis]|uniref:3',5'-cyclic-AMP phosphodiesterase n=1 Tax=Protopolystoma xenopodis TaxID=117903 RepID=A0A448WMB7_9PLAT|nr:unnamed protein product [Protopolystoma xenopodis]
MWRGCCNFCTRYSTGFPTSGQSAGSPGNSGAAVSPPLSAAWRRRGNRVVGSPKSQNSGRKGASSRFRETEKIASSNRVVVTEPLADEIYALLTRDHDGLDDLLPPYGLQPDSGNSSGPGVAPLEATLLSPTGLHKPRSDSVPNGVYPAPGPAFLVASQQPVVSLPTPRHTRRVSDVSSAATDSLTALTLTPADLTPSLRRRNFEIDPEVGRRPTLVIETTARLAEAEIMGFDESERSESLAPTSGSLNSSETSCGSPAPSPLKEISRTLQLTQHHDQVALAGVGDKGAGSEEDKDAGKPTCSVKPETQKPISVTGMSSLFSSRVGRFPWGLSKPVTASINSEATNETAALERGLQKSGLSASPDPLEAPGDDEAQAGCESLSSGLIGRSKKKQRLKKGSSLIKLKGAGSFRRAVAVASSSVSSMAPVGIQKKAPPSSVTAESTSTPTSATPGRDPLSLSPTVTMASASTSLVHSGPSQASRDSGPNEETSDAEEDNGDQLSSLPGQPGSRLHHLLGPKLALLPGVRPCDVARAAGHTPVDSSKESTRPVINPYRARSGSLQVTSFFDLNDIQSPGLDNEFRTMGGLSACSPSASLRKTNMEGVGASGKHTGLRRGSLYIFRNSDEPIVTPFAQVLASLRKVRANFIFLTNVHSSKE